MAANIRLEFHAAILKTLPVWYFIFIPFVFVITRFIFTGIYNLYFHPLSKIPGPKLAAFTELYHSYRILAGNLPYLAKALHDKYGPVVRLGPNRVSFCSASSWKDIYGHYGGRPTFIKSSVYDSPGDPRPANIVSERDPVKHGKMRKMSSHAFSARAIAEQEGIVHKYVDLFIHQIETHVTKKPADMVKWYNFCTFDIIGDLAFGEPFGCLQDGKPHFWVSIILDAITAASWRNLLFRYLGNRKLAKFLTPKKYANKREEHFEYGRDKVIKRMNMETTRKDFMTEILNNKESQELDVDFLTSHASILILAGSETTATFLSGVTYYLCRNPDTYKQLTDEIRTTFKEYDQITGLATEACTYLKAVIEEGLRCYPPSPVALPRLSPGETVDGIFIPAGTEVATNPWAATHSELNFERPYEFIPERWVSNPFGDKREASQPFLLGTRVCLGRNLALLEMRLILAKMLWTFDMELVDDSLDWLRDNFIAPLWRKPALMVKYTKRPGT